MAKSQSSHAGVPNAGREILPLPSGRGRRVGHAVRRMGRPLMEARDHCVRGGGQLLPLTSWELVHLHVDVVTAEGIVGEMFGDRENTCVTQDGGAGVRKWDRDTRRQSKIRCTRTLDLEAPTRHEEGG